MLSVPDSWATSLSVGTAMAATLGCGLQRAVLFALLFALASCRKLSEPEALTHVRRPDQSIVLSGPSAVYVRAEPATPARPENSRTLVARVSFDERHVAKLGPPVQGRVAGINVVTGDQVKAGAVLLTLHAPEMASVQTQIAQARTVRLLAERAAARAEILVRDGAGREAELQQAQAALDQAKNEENRAVAALDAIGGAHGSSEYALRTPIAGTVVERNVSVGTQVHADQDQPLVVVADISTVWVLADVYEQDLSRVHVGDAATIYVLAYPDRTFDGQIAYVSDVVDPLTRSSRARIELANPDLALRPGMFARVEVLASAIGSAELPTSALLARRDQFFVFVRNSDGSYIQREVKIGEQRGQHTTILGGVRAGDMVVTEGAILLDAKANEAL
jgi:cobalt-zinc-cadmium efflux system membrane fusion protein